MGRKLILLPISRIPQQVAGPCDANRTRWLQYLNKWEVLVPYVWLHTDVSVAQVIRKCATTRAAVAGHSWYNDLIKHLERRKWWNRT